ncbi:predicted coding region HP0461 [Helicobacter pylori 26695]|uniref:Uncharacterized protein n=1 Tax=Helicobacter pylori (strain ATCC 700392 / 26695) TaxID=85962 RepID=O25208_HELPY|nr:predicted coding region HP0461 [Helicobacter pylori 26695]
MKFYSKNEVLQKRVFKQQLLLTFYKRTHKG